MASKSSFPEQNFPVGIVKLALEQHSPVIRLAYMEIASGINRLLRRDIPKEVISQLLNKTGSVRT